MEIRKCKGIILSSRTIGESDIISNVLTEQYGKKKFIFKGLKKSRKRSVTASESGTVLDLVYYYKENRESQIVNEFQIIKHYMGIRENLEKIYHLYYILQLIEKTTGYSDVNEPVFKLLNAGIQTLAETPFTEHVSLYLALHLLRFHGVLPDFTACKICGAKNFVSFTLDYNDLCIVCSQCKTGAKPLCNEALGLLTTALSQKFSSVDHGKINREVVLDLLFYITIFIENYFNTIIKSKKFIL